MDQKLQIFTILRGWRHSLLSPGSRSRRRQLGVWSSRTPGLKASHGRWGTRDSHWKCRLVKGFLERRLFSLERRLKKAEPPLPTSESLSNVNTEGGWRQHTHSQSLAGLSLAWWPALGIIPLSPWTRSSLLTQDPGSGWRQCKITQQGELGGGDEQGEKKRETDSPSRELQILKKKSWGSERQLAKPALGDRLKDLVNRKAALKNSP